MKMNCPRCQTELREGAQFCTGCGERIGAGAGDPPSETTREGAPAADPVRLEEELTIVSADALTGQVLDGKYELLRRLGEGGMGAVYRARRVHIGDEVAVKILHPKFVADESASKLPAGSARRRAAPPHNVSPSDYGELDGRAAPYTSWIGRGVSLREL